MTVALTSYTPCPLFDWLRILRFARLFVPLPAGYRWACLRFIRQNEEQREKLRKAGII